MTQRYTQFRMSDRAMDLIVDHLIKKYGLTESRCIYGPAELKSKLSPLVNPFNLYVVSHGADNIPLMTRGSGSDSKHRSDRMTPKQFASELYEALPYGEDVQVKLAMCFGSTEHEFIGFSPESGEKVAMVESFASMTANYIFQFANKPGYRQLDASNIFIGGVAGPAFWDIDENNAPRVPPKIGIRERNGQSIGVYSGSVFERKTRDYFTPSKWQGKMKIDNSDLPNRQRRLSGAIIPTFCYFPFDFDLITPLTHRTTVSGVTGKAKSYDFSDAIEAAESDKLAKGARKRRAQLNAIGQWGVDLGDL